MRLDPEAGRASPVLPFGVLVAVLLLIPALDLSRSTLTLLNHCGIAMVFALSYNMLLGKAGMLSFGHAVYFGLAGFFCLHLLGWIGEGGAFGSFPVFFLPVAGFAVGALAGAVIGWPSCRRSGTPFAMISLGVAELVAALAYMFDSAFGGEMGVSGDRMVGPELLGLSLGPVQEVYWFVAFWTVAGCAGMHAFSRTPLGRLSEAARDNAQRVQYVGYDPARVRYLVFIFAGAFAGMAGGMAAVQDEIITIDALSLAPSGAILIATFVGGVRHFWGPVLGAVLMTWMESNLSDYSEAWLLYLGVAFILVVIYAPEGLAGAVAGAWRLARSADRARMAPVLALRLAGAGCMTAALVVTVEAAMRWSSGHGETFAPLGVPLPHDAPATWIAAVVPAAAGLALLRRARRIEETRT
ncbi:MAG: branched-chain amino acid ABC transporter permease, partial [Pseudomonadota bacterium]|nr:branched-chain amino acid ABC transporter permease [Pseudomonadota bacterium]